MKTSKVAELKARIAALDPSDPCALAERFILQERLAKLLGMATTGTPDGTRIRHHQGPTPPAVRPRTASTTQKQKAKPATSRPAADRGPGSASRSEMLAWDESQWRRLAEWSHQKGHKQLQTAVAAMLKTKKSSSRNRQICEIYILLQQVRKGKQKSRPAPAGGRPVTRGSSRSNGSGGEAMALFNRLGQLNRGVSFEESVALRQGSRGERRQLIERVDRALSGSQEDLDDVDW